MIRPLSERRDAFLTHLYRFGRCFDNQARIASRTSSETSERALFRASARRRAYPGWKIRTSNDVLFPVPGAAGLDHEL
jgi:hypothetical protein